MLTEFLAEPELEFGGGGIHVDARFGLLRHGPYGKGLTEASGNMKLGIVGTDETIAGLRAWFDLNKGMISGKKSRLHNLYPEFPGFSVTSCFKSSIETSDGWNYVLPGRLIDGLVTSAGAGGLAPVAAAVLLDGARSVFSSGGLSLVIIAPPQNLLNAVERGRRADAFPDPSEPYGLAGSQSRIIGGNISPFDELLKLKAVELGLPVMIVPPQVYALEMVHGDRKRSKPLPGSRDLSIRAWSFYVQLFHKAGGVPWSLRSEPSRRSKCYVGYGISRRRGGSGDSEGIAAVFDDTGNGMVLTAGKSLRAAPGNRHNFSCDDSKDLLARGIEAFRAANQYMPAEVIIHSAHELDSEEIEGFMSAAAEKRVSVLDLVSVFPSTTRLFRMFDYPPLRGTFLRLEEKRGLVYLQGSVNFLQAFPGRYVPVPVEFIVHRSEKKPSLIAERMLALSKLERDESPFFGAEPITIRAVKKAAAILRHAPQSDRDRLSYRLIS